MTLVDVRPIGVMRMIDDNALDDKIIAVPVSDPSYNSYNSINDLPAHIFDEMMHFFTVYKQLESKQTAVKELFGPEEAKNIIKECINKVVTDILNEQKENTLDILVENILDKNIKTILEDKRKKSNKKNANKKHSVIQWLRKPEIDTAEIRRKLEGEPESQEEEDSKRSYFMKKVNQKYGKDFTSDEINSLYAIKTGLGQ
jgi:hypothetical protein